MARRTGSRKSGKKMSKNTKIGLAVAAGAAVLASAYFMFKKGSPQPPKANVQTVAAWTIASDTAATYPAAGLNVYWPAYPSSPYGSITTAAYFANYSAFQAENNIITTTYPSS